MFSLACSIMQLVLQVYFFNREFISVHSCAVLQGLYCRILLLIALPISALSFCSYEWNVHSCNILFTLAAHTGYIKKKKVLKPHILFSALVFKTTKCQLRVEAAALSSSTQRGAHGFGKHTLFLTFSPFLPPCQERTAFPWACTHTFLGFCEAGWD